MISVVQPIYSIHQNKGCNDYCPSMNELAKRFNEETRRLTANTGRSVIVTKRKATSYTPILN